MHGQNHIKQQTKRIFLSNSMSLFSSGKLELFRFLTEAFLRTSAGSLRWRKERERRCK